MVTILSLFFIMAGLISSYAIAKNNSLSVQSISYLILGLGILALTLPFHVHEKSDEISYVIPLFLGGVLLISFVLGEIFRNKIGLGYNLIPIVLALSIFILPDLTEFSYRDFKLDSTIEFFIIALISAVTPFLTHLAKLGIGILVIRFGNINWAENEENYLESLVSYAFIGGIAALGAFLIGGLGLIVAATFYLSASFIARNKLGLKNDIILAGSGAIFLLVSVPIINSFGGYDALNLLRPEVIEGAFIAGFAIIVHELFMKLARFNTNNWRYIFAMLAIGLPVLAIITIGLAYNIFERLGGVLALSSFVTALALLSIMFTLFKNSNFVNLKLISLGTILLILPYSKPVERSSNIDLEELGIEKQAPENENKDGEDNKKEPVAIEEATGKWKIQEENSKIFFELGAEGSTTEGEFESVAGSFEITENLSNSIFDITLKVQDLTTYITPRDNELMGKGYFNEEEYPEITYKTEIAEKSSDGLTLIGDFTMMGVTKELKVDIEVIGIGEKDREKVLVLGGNSQIDRTEFGQKASSKIGSEVTFEIEIQAISGE